MGRYNPVEFCGEIKHETDKAYLVYDGENEVWIPKSQIQDCHCVSGSNLEFTTPEWLAEEKGII